MVTDKTAKAQAKRLRGLRFVPDEGRDEVGAVMLRADNDGHLKRAVDYILEHEHTYPTPLVMRSALDMVPRTLADGCSLCQGRGLVYVDDVSPVGSVAFCSCQAGDAKREATDA
jgi:hypothetical protein